MWQPTAGRGRVRPLRPRSSPRCSEPGAHCPGGGPAWIPGGAPTWTPPGAEFWRRPCCAPAWLRRGGVPLAWLLCPAVFPYGVRRNYTALGRDSVVREREAGAVIGMNEVSALDVIELEE